MKAQTKLVIGMVIAMIAVLIASQSATHSAGMKKMKHDRIKMKQSGDIEKDKMKTKHEATRDLSSGSENIQ